MANQLTIVFNQRPVPGDRLYIDYVQGNNQPGSYLQIFAFRGGFFRETKIPETYNNNSQIMEFLFATKRDAPSFKNVFDIKVNGNVLILKLKTQPQVIDISACIIQGSFASYVLGNSTNNATKHQIRFTSRKYVKYNFNSKNILAQNSMKIISQNNENLIQNG